MFFCCFFALATIQDDLQVPVNVKVVLIGFENGDGAYEFNMASQPLHDLVRALARQILTFPF